MDSAAFTSEPPTGPEKVVLAQPSPCSAPDEPAADVWIGFSIEQLQQLVVDFVALRNSSILAADQMPTLAAFAERCRLEYRARTGRELVVQAIKEARR